MRPRAFPHHANRLVVPMVMAVACTVLTGCGDKKERPPTQTAAKVNKEELTVHQINAVLAQQRGLRPEHADVAGRQVLERLIDQELAMQKAAELRLDRDPRVVQAVEAARREIVARAYADKIGEGVAKPTAAEVRKYYEDNPALFRERRVYQVTEFAVQIPPQQVPDLRERLRGTRSVADVAQMLKAADFKFTSAQMVRAAEQLSFDRLAALSSMSEGQWIVSSSSGGAQVVFLVAARSQPVDEARAAPAIEQFLLNDRRRKLVGQDLRSLRDAAKIEYVGKFAEAAPLGDGAAVDLAPSALDMVASRAHETSASGVEGAEAAARPADTAAAATIRKGLGLK
jgi:EpsD family peptidyl-prolyl cis-trans isomerase